MRPSSPLQRAAATTAGVLSVRQDGLTASLDNGLLEVDLEPWSGLTAEERAVKDPEGYATWRQQPEELELKRADGTHYKPIADLMNQARQFKEPDGASPRIWQCNGAGGWSQRHSPMFDSRVARRTPRWV